MKFAIAPLGVAALSLAVLAAPAPAVACGWGGDAEYDGEEPVYVDAQGNMIDDNPVTDPIEQTRIADAYRLGGGDVEQDYAEAAFWYRKAADQNHPVALNNLAVLHEKGLGVPRNDDAAARLFKIAAELGDHHAQHSLGVMYRDGRGVERDPEAAAKWIRRAALQGHTGAFKDLGFAYREGAGIPRDEVQAYMWLEIAAAHGDQAGAQQRDLLGTGMAAGRIAEAEKLAREWTPAKEAGE